MGLWDLGDGAPLIIDFREQNTATTGPFVDGDGLKMLTVPIINTINECRTGTNISVSLSSIPMLAGTVVRDFQVLLPNNTLLVVPASNGTGSFMYVINGTVDQIRQFRVYATDTLGNRSGVAVKDVKIIANKKPIIDSLIHNIPSTIKVGRSVICRLNGAYDPEGDALTYSLTLPPLFTSTKIEDILPNDNFTLTVDLSHAVNVTVPILVAVEDKYGDTDDTLINVTVLPNNPPDITTLVTSFPHSSSVYYGNSFTFSFNSIYDADGDVVLIDITNSYGLTFNKTSNISIGETITASITGTGTLTMTVQAKDNYGGVSNTREYTVYSSVYVPPPPPDYYPPYYPPSDPSYPPPKQWRLIPECFHGTMSRVPNLYENAKDLYFYAYYPDPDGHHYIDDNNAWYTVVGIPITLQPWVTEGNKATTYFELDKNRRVGGDYLYSKNLDFVYFCNRLPKSINTRFVVTYILE